MATIKFNSKDWNATTDNPKLGVRMLKDGRASLCLFYSFGWNKEKCAEERKMESLKLYLNKNPRTPVERQQNKETLALAIRIKDERGQMLLEDREGYRVKQKGINLFGYFANFVKNSGVKNKFILEGALKNFHEFICKEYPQFADRIEPKYLNKAMMQRFSHYIEKRHKGEGIRTYWQRFKRLINYAVEQKVIKESPCRGIKVVSTDDILSKDILSREELQRLFATHYDKESKTIRRAFALTCFTGIRHCDLRRLTYGNIDYSNKLMTFRQSKVEHDSSVSGVTIPLNDTLLAIIGKKPKGAKDSDLIFKMPTIQSSEKALKCWVAKAGIDKHITWHCGRHSFATNMLSNGANIKVVSELLGHSSLKFTQKYVRALDSQKKAAIDSLPQIDVSNI
ncbi:MAG: site-specific integrase [Prevotella sp.]|jgi:site-specific recombinase XerD|uniref:Site-specific integrase n=1 Tax=Segatella cerevisiae TaxID=2053716 RepID=A0ABT1C1G9_9BACT|nr:site-specific integrase [Segatella cerevisiae]MCH3994924.1 site-specific integrase [Prevotella sp.]MCI1246173.1 site-specific integrase [Prevotella sp.]MCO6026343.1 site-specific integrase [Segatella cerevisiae]